MKAKLLAQLSGKQSTDHEQYFYKDSETVLDLLAKVVACSITGINISLVGPTGYGKTSMAIAFSEISAGKLQRKTPPYQLYSFHMESKIEDIFGTYSIVNGSIVVVKGPLYQCLEKGQVFIADEVNLAEIPTIQSLLVALDQPRGNKVFNSRIF